MISKIVKGYGALFSGVAHVVLLLIVCTAIGSAFVLPLWAFAMKAPVLYTICTLIIFSSLCVFFVAKKAKQAGYKRSIRFLLQLFIVVAGIAGIILFVLHEKRILAALTLLLCIILYGITSFGLSLRHDA